MGYQDKGYQEHLGLQEVRQAYRPTCLDVVCLHVPWRLNSSRRSMKGKPVVRSRPVLALLPVLVRLLTVRHLHAALVPVEKPEALACLTKTPLLPLQAPSQRDRKPQCRSTLECKSTRVKSFQQMV